MIFKITDKEFFKDNPEALAIPIFKSIGNKGMKFIALVYGYNTPFRKLHIPERKAKAIKLCGFRKTPTGRLSKEEKNLMESRGVAISAAIKEYMSIQFDDDRDTLDALDNQIKDFKDIQRRSGKDSKEIDQCIKISKAMPDLILTRKSLEDILEMRQDSFYGENENEVVVSSASDVEEYLENI